MILRAQKRSEGTIEFFGKKFSQSFSIFVKCLEIVPQEVTRTVAKKLSFLLMRSVGKSIVVVEDGDQKKSLRVNVTMPQKLDSYGATLIANDCYDKVLEVLDSEGLM